jgi:hypothetical protein
MSALLVILGMYVMVKYCPVSKIKKHAEKRVTFNDSYFFYFVQHFILIADIAALACGLSKINNTWLQYR